MVDLIHAETHSLSLTLSLYMVLYTYTVRIMYVYIEREMRPTEYEYEWEVFTPSSKKWRDHPSPNSTKIAGSLSKVPILNPLKFVYS